MAPSYSPVMTFIDCFLRAANIANIGLLRPLATAVKLKILFEANVGNLASSGNSERFQEVGNKERMV